MVFVQRAPVGQMPGFRAHSMTSSQTSPGPKKPDAHGNLIYNFKKSNKNYTVEINTNIHQRPNTYGHRLRSLRKFGKICKKEEF